jgi:tripartite-type tricarboxylate transporter receptor subunit TctC
MPARRPRPSGFAGIGTSHWHGLFASRRVPAGIVTRLHASVVQALDSQSVRTAFGDAGAGLVPSASPAKFAAEVRAEMAEWEKVRADIALKIE